MCDALDLTNSIQTAMYVRDTAAMLEEINRTFTSEPRNGASIMRISTHTHRGATAFDSPLPPAPNSVTKSLSCNRGVSRKGSLSTVRKPTVGRAGEVVPTHL